MCKVIRQLFLIFIFVSVLYTSAPAQVIERLCNRKMSVEESIAAASRRRKKERLNSRDSLVLCNGGILDSLATSKPEPVYPVEAKAAGVSGTVAMRVCIDEKGRVYALAKCFGPRELMPAAIKAAYQARFKPSLRGGKPVKFNGILTYKFTARPSQL